MSKKDEISGAAALHFYVIRILSSMPLPLQKRIGIVTAVFVRGNFMCHIYTSLFTVMSQKREPWWQILSCKSCIYGGFHDSRKLDFDILFESTWSEYSTCPRKRPKWTAVCPVRLNQWKNWKQHTQHPVNPPGMGPQNPSLFFDNSTSFSLENHQTPWIP